MQAKEGEAQQQYKELLRVAWLTKRIHESELQALLARPEFGDRKEVVLFTVRQTGAEVVRDETTPWLGLHGLAGHIGSHHSNIRQAFARGGLTFGWRIERRDKQPGDPVRGRATYVYRGVR